MNDEPQLIDGYLDGELTADEERRLAEWLASSPENPRDNAGPSVSGRRGRDR